MPTVTLRYTLPDEQDDFDAARQGAASKRVLREIGHRCRALVKYGGPYRWDEDSGAWVNV